MMRRYHTIALALAVFSALALAGCGGSSGPEQATLTDVNSAQLEAMLAAPQSLHRHSRFVARLHPAARVPRRCRRARAISTCLAKTWAVHDTKG